jgi:PPOX class probable F420-dependent enzyme
MQTDRVLEPYAKRKTAVLTSFRADGTAVPTAVTIAVEGDHAFVRTFDQAGKMKRIRRNREVEIVPSSILGRPSGPSLRAHVRFLKGSEADHASTLISRRHRVLQGLLVPLYHRARGYRTIHMELTPIGGERSGGTFIPPSGV